MAFVLLVLLALFIMDKNVLVNQGSVKSMENVFKIVKMGKLLIMKATVIGAQLIKFKLMVNVNVRLDMRKLDKFAN